MEKTVLFRTFEERDLDFIFKCKSDEKLNSMVVGNFRPLSKEESKQWLDGCIRADNPTMKFWAICTNDDEKRIVGWVSLSKIDKANKSAHFHGIVIGDDVYRDGFAWIESYLFILEYVFEKLSLHRLTGCHLAEHPMTGYISKAMNFKEEGLFRDAVYKNGRYYDEVSTAILDSEYFAYKAKGGFDYYTIMSNIIKLKKQLKWN